MALIDDMPLELIYKILLQTSYNDILSYCASHSKVSFIWDDMGFWMNKLDNDFGDRLQPSVYVKNFGVNNNGRDTYKRWDTYINVSTVSVIDNIDIIMYNIDRYGASERIVRQIMDFSIENNNPYLLQQLENRGFPFFGTNFETANNNIKLLEERIFSLNT